MLDPNQTADEDDDFDCQCNRGYKIGDGFCFNLKRHRRKFPRLCQLLDSENGCACH